MKASAINTGPGRVLVGLYALFALSAGARAAVQIATQFDEAPVAYLLSALAAVIYLAATIGFLRGGRGGRRLAMTCCAVELATFIGYLLTSVLFLPAALSLSFMERTRWGSVIAGSAALVVAVLTLRLQQVWTPLQ